MYTAINNSLLGDDVYEDDPTTKDLENYACKLLGKEAALLVPTGTFGNQLAILTHTNRGDEVLVGEDTHIPTYEVGAAAVISAVTLRTIPIKNKLMDITSIKKYIRSNNIHFPKTGLISIENAHSLGFVSPENNMEAISIIGKKFNIPIHMDGARFFNAAAALNIDYKSLASYSDSINICLSKGLCAPIGSLLLGNKDFINTARKNRKLMGGGMRQTGIIAGAGLVGLKEMTKRIYEDHENAKYLSKKLEEINGITIDNDNLDINMVFFNLPESIIPNFVLAERLFNTGIKINSSNDGNYRFVTHNDIKIKDIDYLIDEMKKIISNSLS